MAHTTSLDQVRSGSRGPSAESGLVRKRERDTHLMAGCPLDGSSFRPACFSKDVVILVTGTELDTPSREVGQQVQLKVITLVY